MRNDVGKNFNIPYIESYEQLDESFANFYNRFLLVLKEFMFYSICDLGTPSPRLSVWHS